KPIAPPIVADCPHLFGATESMMATPAGVSLNQPREQVFATLSIPPDGRVSDRPPVSQPWGRSGSAGPKLLGAAVVSLWRAAAWSHDVLFAPGSQASAVWDPAT